MTREQREWSPGVLARILPVALTAALVVAACSSDGDDATTATTLEPMPPLTVATPTDATVTQPHQPTEGPGSSAYAHRDVRVSSGGEGADAWYVFEPSDPAPDDAPVAVVLHGYFEFEGYEQMEEFLLHTARTGTIAIFPRWQVDVVDPCPGPVDIEPCIDAAVAGIEGAIEYLQDDPDRVQPRLDSAAYFGFSFGGILATNIANRSAELGVPEPAVVFLDDPHDGAIVDQGETALDRPLEGIPESVLFVCHVGEFGVIAGPGAADSSCNAIFPQLGHIPDANLALIMTRADDHGLPALTSHHGVCAAHPGQVDAYDWNMCWRIWDALRSAAAGGPWREYALGGGPEQTDNGSWSDGTPIAPVEVADGTWIGP